MLAIPVATPAAQPENLLPGAAGGDAASPPASAALPASAPPADSDRRAPPRSDRRVPPEPARIQVGELAAPGEAPIGSLSPQQGAFAPAFWQGSRAAALQPLFDSLTGGTASGVLQDLRRRLLMTPAEPPQGISADDFLALRLAALLDGGAAADARALAGARPAALGGNPALARLAADAAWLGRAAPSACDIVAGAAQGDGSAYWERAGLLCKIAQGDTALAALAANSIVEVSERPDSFFLAARQILNAGPDTVSANPFLATLPGLEPDAPIVALFDLTHARPPDGFGRGASPAALAAIAVLPQAPLAMQRQAAEAAVGFGALPPEELARLWLAAAEDDDGASNAPARTYRSLDAEVRDPRLPSVGDDRVDAALLAGRSAGMEAAMARTAAPLLARLRPGMLNGRTAADVMRAFLRAGNVEEALSWWQRLKALPGNREAEAATTGIWPLLFLAAPPGHLPWSDSAFAAWAGSIAGLPFATQQERERTFLTLADALGRRNAPDLRGGPAGAGLGSERQRAVQQQFDEAVAGARQGEALLAVLALFHPAGPAEADLATVAHAVAGLDRLGLAAEARRLAVEAALGAGL